MMATYAQAKQTPLVEPDQLDRYRISGGKIIELLQQMSKQHSIITAYFDAGRRFLLTTLIAILPDQHSLVFDYGPDAAATKRALLTRRLLCTVQLDGVSVRFTADQLEEAKYQGEAALVATLPAIAYYIQRRDNIRLRIPPLSPATCTLPLGGGKMLTLPLADISRSGLSLISHSDQLASLVMNKLHGCRLTLPEFGELDVDLQIRNHCHDYLYTHEKVERYGALFLHLSDDNERLLQRYITKLQMAALTEEM